MKPTSLVPWSHLPCTCPSWPVRLMPPGAPAQAAFVGAMAIADLVKTTLGPKGMVRVASLCHLLTDRSMWQPCCGM